jgi:hypothetical protein
VNSKIERVLSNADLSKSLLKMLHFIKAPMQHQRLIIARSVLS